MNQSDDHADPSKISSEGETESPPDTDERKAIAESSELGKQVVGVWVEIRERNEEGRIVLMSIEANVPPGRGRRILRLNEDHSCGSGMPSARDALEAVASGRWHIESQLLHIDLPGWEGKYRIAGKAAEELILERR